MDWKKLVLCFATSGALALVGCGDDDGNGAPVDAGADGPTVPPDETFVIEPLPNTCPEDPNVDPEEGETLYFVVATLGFGGRDSVTGHTSGFNIDGANTRPDETQGDTGCGHMDGEYDINKDGVIEGPERGIDNQLSQLTDILGGELDLQGEVNSGSIIILAKLIGVEDPQNDTCVVAELLLANLPADAEMELEGGQPAPGQTFEIDEASYDADGNALIRGQGVIENGRLIIGPVTISLSIALDAETDLDLVISNASVAWTMDGTLEGGLTLEEGLIGGGLNVDELLTELGPLLEDFGLDVETVRPIIDQLSDLEPDANNQNCESLSLGLTFTAVDAVVEEEPAI